MNLAQKRVLDEGFHPISRLVLATLRAQRRLPPRDDLAVLTSTMPRSKQLIDEIGWGVWCHEQLLAVQTYAPKVLEVGAGNGFFGLIAAAYGLHVRLTEKVTLARNGFYQQPMIWDVRIDRLTALQAMEEDPDVPVLLCWPPGETGYVGRIDLHPVGMQVAKALPRGGRLLYLGDAAMCAAGGAGLRALLANFAKLARVPGPCWAEPAAPEVLLVLEKL